MSTAFRVVLEGEQEVPPRLTTASGLGTVIFDSTAVTARYSFRVQGLDFGGATPTTDDDATRTHFHNNVAGQNGPIVFGQIDTDPTLRDDEDDLSVVLNADGSWTISGLWETSDPANVSIANFATVLGSARPGDAVPLYFNVHSSEFPGGEIRGQLVAIADDRSNVVTGTDGNDLLPGLGGNDRILGLAGDDTLQGGNGNDRMFGGEGNDTASGGRGNDLVVGGDGDDTLNGDEGSDRLLGGDGIDNLSGGAGHDRLAGGDGDDTASGDAGHDVISGGDGDDTLEGGNGNDRMFGGNGEDQIDGGDGRDKLFGGDENDVINAGSGNDLALGGDGDDEVNGDAGNDRLLGQSGDDTIDGGVGNDFAFGGNGDDTIVGGNGNDRLFGGNGEDSLTGGLGRDELDGGSNSDTFIFLAPADSGGGAPDAGNVDVVKTFQAGGNTAATGIDLLSFDVTTALAADIHTLGEVILPATVLATWGAAGDGDNDVTVFKVGGEQYLAVQGDDSDVTFDVTEDYVIRVDAITGTLNATDIVLV